MTESKVDRPRTVLGFDFGYRRIGVAVGQEFTGMARPIATLITRQQCPDWAAIVKLICQWQPQLLVVGIPYLADGRPSTLTAAALRFSRQLHDRYRLPVATIDERLSSREAEGLIAARPYLSRRQRRDKSTVDQVAAALILESWFNHHKVEMCKISNS